MQVDTVKILSEFSIQMANPSNHNFDYIVEKAKHNDMIALYTHKIKKELKFVEYCTIIILEEKHISVG